ncbi:MAG: PEP-CTERM sorting domain-containing protein [Gammaproteobacteria bacterium]|nr:MAG: PEP-CTERM sorting domain-containing protein [Gammaproteobacteria bacterium]
MNVFKKMMAASALCLCAGSALAAPVLSFGNAGANVAHDYTVGDSIALDLWVSGLDGSDDLGGLDLAGFDFNLSFNGAVTGYQGTTFSSDLDDSLFYGLDASPISSNSVNLSGLSLLADLSAQASEFKLFTLLFSADHAGISSIKIDDFILANSWFGSFSSDNFLADITVNEKSVTVPEPSSLGLLLLALGALVIRRRNAV